MSPHAIRFPDCPCERLCTAHTEARRRRLEAQQAEYRLLPERLLARMARTTAPIRRVGQAPVITAQVPVRWNRAPTGGWSCGALAGTL